MTDYTRVATAAIGVAATTAGALIAHTNQDAGAGLIAAGLSMLGYSAATYVPNPNAQPAASNAPKA